MRDTEHVALQYCMHGYCGLKRMWGRKQGGGKMEGRTVLVWLGWKRDFEK